MQDKICDDVWNAEQIVAHALTLKPELAIINWDRDWRPFCTTCIYTRVKDEHGEIVELESPQGRVVAIYGRVSTIRQRGDERDDGYSIQHQFYSSVIACIKTLRSFRIYSDSGFSGFLMTNDEVLKREVREAQANLYGKIFEDVLLKNAESWNTPTQIGDMRRFLETRKADIKRGVKETLIAEKPDDHNTKRIEDALVMRFQHHNSTNAFRPALHALMEDAPNTHSIFITDPDRLSRNQILFVALGKLFRLSETQVFTASGEATWISGTDLTSQLLAVVLPHQAEQKLKQVKEGVMRGFVTMLRQGKPHSALPFWLERDKNKLTRFVPEHLPTIQRMLKLAMEDEHIGIARIAQALVELNVPSPHNKLWHGDTVGYALRNPWLFGCQVMFGREWPMKEGEVALGEQFVSPFLKPDERDPKRPLALITREQFLRMHDRRQARYQNAKGRPTPDKKVMASLLVCRCGYKMVYKQAQSQKGAPDAYKCNGPSTERRLSSARGIVHTVLRPDQVDAFFISLVADYANLVVKERPDNNTDNFDAQEQAVRAEFEQTRKAKRAEVAAMLKAGGAREDTHEFQAAVESMLRAILGDQYKAYQETLDRIERQRDLRRAATRRQTNEGEIKRFRELNSGEKNGVLRSLIKKVTVGGDPGHEYLLIHLHDGDPLPPVYLPTRVYKNGTLHRRVPTVAEWIMTWKVDD